MNSNEDKDSYRWDKVDFWSKLSSIGVIDMSFNLLKVVPEGLLELTNERLVEVILDSNPLQKNTDNELNLRPIGPFSLGWSELVGQRPTQEDCLLINGSLGDDTLDMGVFGLFEGHVSRAAAQFASIHFVDHLLRHIPFDDIDRAPLEALRQSIHSINTSWKDSITSPQCSADSNLKLCGSTGVVALILGNNLYVANVGDSRAILYTGGLDLNEVEESERERALKDHVIRLTHDHKPEYEDEENRIRETGGYVVDGRLGGILGVSRGIGDFYMYPMVSAESYLSVHQLPLHRDAFLLICCDGVWDELTDEDAVCLVHDTLKRSNNESLHSVATKLRDYSFLMGSDDNISTMIIKWDHIRRPT